jgi:diaminopimelate decarboxylase
VRQKFGLTLRDLNIGGGLGIAYTEADDPLPIPATMATLASYIADYAQTIDYPLPSCY